MEDKLKWEFNCPQYVDFRKPLDEIDDSDSFFEIDHENHIKSILKKRIDEKENVKPLENFVCRKQSEESTTSCEFITPPSHLSFENKLISDLNLSKNNDPDLKCDLFYPRESNSESSTEIKSFGETRTINNSQKNLIKLETFEKKQKLYICSENENKFSTSSGILKKSKIPLLERNIKNIHLKNLSFKCLYNNIEKDRNKKNHKVIANKNIQDSLRINVMKNNENNHKTTITEDPLHFKTKLKYITEKQKIFYKISPNHLGEKSLQNKKQENLKINIKNMKAPLNSKDIIKETQENKKNFPKVIQNSLNRKTIQYNNQKTIKYMRDSLNCKITEKKIQGNLNCPKIILNSLNNKNIQCKNQNNNNKNIRDPCKIIEKKIQGNLNNCSRVIQNSVKSIQNKNQEKTIIKDMKNLSNFKTTQKNIQENKKIYSKTIQNSLNNKNMQNKTQENLSRKCSQLNSNSLTSKVQGNGKCVVYKNINNLAKHNEILNNSRKTTVKNITPECLKRSQNKDLKKYIKSTEELEMEKIISLQKQLKEHCRLSKISMAKAISRQSVQPMKENISKNRK